MTVKIQPALPPEVTLTEAQKALRETWFGKMPEVTTPPLKDFVDPGSHLPFSSQELGDVS